MLPRMALTPVIIAMLSLHVFAQQGTVTMKNGRSMKGNISRCSDGSCWVATPTGSIKFEHDEIKSISLVHKSPQTFPQGNQTYVPVSDIREPHINGVPTNTTYDDLICQAALKHNLDPALIKAVMQAESNFNPLDRSRKGACGLMQLMPATAHLLGVRDIYNPKENVSAGARYLRTMLDIFDGNLDKAVAAYNAGPAAVQKYAAIPPYRETRDYVRKVKTYMKQHGRGNRIVDYTDEQGKLNLFNVR